MTCLVEGSNRNLLRDGMLTENVFKKIVDGQIPTTLLHEDDLVLAFKDIHPQAKIHVLIIPKKEIRTHADLTAEDLSIIARMHQVAQKLANDFGLKPGYRLVINCDRGGGQTVPHLHMHLLGGRSFGWPPG